MNNVMIFTIGKWRFAVREEDLSMISNNEKQAIEKWKDKVIEDKWMDVKAINEPNSYQFLNYIYFIENDIMHCLGVDSMSYPKNENSENIFFFSHNSKDGGIIGLLTEDEEIISIVDLGNFFKKWLDSKLLINL